MVLKPKVLVFIDWYLPGYKAGGPIKSVSNIVNSLQKEVDFSIITSNTDFGVEEPYEDIVPNVWIYLSGFRVMYLDIAHQTLRNYRKLQNEERYDFLYFNSLFSTKFTLLPLLANKLNSGLAEVVLAPRGMLGIGALNLKKNKKRLFIKAAKMLGLFKGVTWHASTSFEAEEICNVFGKKQVVKIATNIASLPSNSVPRSVKTTGNTSFFFLSRVAPKKNLLGALQAFYNLKTTQKVSFNIIGPIEDNSYWDSCQELIKKLPENIEVNYLGAVPNPELPALLQNFHFLFLPTFSENYGHVVVESWANGCPVILSDQTPWRNLEKLQIGWDIPLSESDKFLSVLHKCIDMENEEFRMIQSHIERYIYTNVITEEIMNQNRELFSLTQ